MKLRFRRVEFSVEAGEAVSKFIWEYIQSFGTAEDQVLVADLQGSVGVVTVHSSRAVAPLTLRQNNAGATFPEAVPTLTTFPVTPDESTPPSRQEVPVSQRKSTIG